MSGTFLNGVMLAGVGGAAVPLVLHLLSRARYRSVDWGAMMFLQDIDAQTQFGTGARQWVLLLLRMAVVALLAMGLARPVIAGRWGGHAGASSVDVVIVLDRSASMAAPEAGRTRFDLAKEAVLQILSSLRKGDRVALVLAGDGSMRNGATTALQVDLQDAAARVADLRVSSGAADFALELPAALAAFDPRSRAARELYVVTDTQASSWSHVEMPFPLFWRRRIAQMEGDPPQVHVITIGSGWQENVAVESLRLMNPPAVAGTPTTVEVKLRNHGVAPRELPLIVRSPQGTLYSDLVRIDAGTEAVVAFTTLLKNVGPQVLTAEVRSDVLADDRAQLAVEVMPAIRVQVVSGDESPQHTQAESFYLRAALAPFTTAGRAGVDLAVVNVTPWEQWQPSIAGNDVLVLANIPELTPAQARAVEQFVYAGGGLLIAPGSLTRPERYNAQLRRDATPILSAEIEPAKHAAQPDGLAVSTVDADHPAFGYLDSGVAGPVATGVSRYLPARPDDHARILARYGNDAPFLIESTYGGGRVMLLTTTVDADWSGWPHSSLYLPLMQSIVKRLALASADDRNLIAGEDLRAAFDGIVDGGKASLALPSGPRRSVDVVQFGGRSEIRFDATGLPGLYTLTAAVGGEERVLRYVVRPLPREADPSPLSAPRWVELETMLGLTRIDAPQEALADALAEVRTGRELWAGLLILVTVLGLIEMILARRWSAEAS